MTERMTERFQQLQQWLANCDYLQNTDFTLPVPASNDASFRRYYRIEVTQKGHAQTCIIMDAPPEHEDCEPFVRIAQQLASFDLNVPLILAEDLVQGFLLLSDLGSETYLSCLNEQNVDGLYQDALTALVQLQVKGKQAANNLPLYDETLLNTEMNLFTDLLLEKQLAIGLSNAEKTQWQTIQGVLAKSAMQQPQVYVHRDYHSRNLMVQPADLGASNLKNPGILDFQDAVKGALTYDAVSMLRDCYITWPAEQVVEWQRQYFLMLVEAKMLSQAEWQGFVKAMDLMGIQRHLKASGIFARLSLRDGKESYLADIPATLNYLFEVGQQYPEMRSLVTLLEQKVLPAMQNQRHAG